MHLIGYILYAKIYKLYPLWYNSGHIFPRLHILTCRQICKTGKNYQVTDRAALNLFDTLVHQLAQAEGVTEALKVQDQMEWLCRMNSVQTRAEEIVTNELIC